MEKNYNLRGKGANGNSAVNNYNKLSSMSISNGMASIHSAKKIEDTQWMKYKHKTGHGFAAEDVNAQIDRWHGRNVDCVGRNNALMERIESSMVNQSRPNIVKRRTIP